MSLALSLPGEVDPPQLCSTPNDSEDTCACRRRSRLRAQSIWLLLCKCASSCGLLTAVVC